MRIKKVKSERRKYMSKFVYADNAATTNVSPEVLREMMPYFGSEYGNPSSLYSIGRSASLAISAAREKIASLLGAKSNEIYFTSCGSESDNWAIKGAAHANAAKGKHIITTVYEHHAVLHTMDSLKKEGFEITYLKVDSNGQITPEELEAAIRPDTILIAAMFANNEIGSVLPIKEFAAVAKRLKSPSSPTAGSGCRKYSGKRLGARRRYAFHSQGTKYMHPRESAYSMSKPASEIANLIDGGGQERGRRGGTENVAYIVGLAKALELAVSGLSDMGRIAAMRDRLATEIIKNIPYSRINGGMEHRLPGNLNVSFEFIEGESLILLLDMAGICASTGSACSTASLEPSHVLLSIVFRRKKLTARFVLHFPMKIQKRMSIIFWKSFLPLYKDFVI